MRRTSGPIGWIVMIMACGQSAALDMRIDPEPGSPLLGELIAREAAIPAIDAPRPEPAARREVRAVPHVPRGATTVLVPGGKLR